MKFKKCTKCYKEKLLTEFYKNSNRKDGLGVWCKNCELEQKKQHYFKNHESYSGYAKWYNFQHQIKEKRKKYNSKPEVREKQREYYSKPEVKERKNKYNQEKYKTEGWKEYQRNWNNNKLKDDPIFKIKKYLRNRLWNALKNDVKSKSTLELLGCTIEECKQYIEQQFKEPMSWLNHGIIWEFDHTKPCASFDLSKKEEQEKCFHYTNLQPLFKTTTIAESYGYKGEIGNRNKSNK